MKRIVVLLEGFSSEKEVSKVTGESIFEVLSKEQDIRVEKYYLSEDIVGFIDFYQKIKR